MNRKRLIIALIVCATALLSCMNGPLVFLDAKITSQLIAYDTAGKKVTYLIGIDSGAVSNNAFGSTSQYPYTFKYIITQSDFKNGVSVKNGQVGTYASFESTDMTTTLDDGVTISMEGPKSMVSLQFTIDYSAL